MSDKSNLKDLFDKWNELNKQIGESFGELDFQTIKEYRKDQRKVEDIIYEILKNNASEELRIILPETCGEMEIGFEFEKQKFYFLMEDPDEEVSNDEEMVILAITINKEGKIDTIKNFEREEI